MYILRSPSLFSDLLNEGLERRGPGISIKNKHKNYPTYSIKEIIDQLDSIKIKNFLKDTVKRMKRQVTEKIFANHTSNKELVLRTHKSLSKLIIMNTNNLIQI